MASTNRGMIITIGGMIIRAMMRLKTFSLPVKWKRLKAWAASAPTATVRATEPMVTAAELPNQMNSLASSIRRR